MTPLTLPAARALSIRPLPIGTATTWTPTGARDGLSAPLGTYLEHASAADAAAHVARENARILREDSARSNGPGPHRVAPLLMARILSCTEPISTADHDRLLSEARAALSASSWTIIAPADEPHHIGR